ncbi:wax ester/triacylglycerol synthase family O-acyltransferase [Parahaliea maris]|uniref:diacylglycerol O-acyltransferase n=1 Tax=Parahaliea maris TaxID=2716870 RepID=A0A5C9A2X2_9GAMM|nr:wax ester/triacylglycerol synthase family O-acyltransferase [Parahaliea maris]TXS95223.1 wax ester/triacylglycerol synthase family O-acyltransferase [Parahaliea maris]
MQQLTGQDAMFLHTEMKGLPQHIGGIAIYNPATAKGGRVRFKDILAMLRSRLHLSPIFRRKLATVPLGLGQPYWVEDPNFELEYHVRHIALPAPGDWRQLCIQAARIHAIPLDREKPLWEIYIIEGLDNVEGLPAGCFAMLLKVHHCAMDGATGAHFITLMHDRSPEVEIPEQAPAPQPTPVSYPLMLARAYMDAWRVPFKAMGMLWDALPTYRRLRHGYAEHKFEHLGEIPRTRFQGRISPHRVVDARVFDFATIRAMKQAVPGATINDAMLNIVAGGLRRYLEPLDELPDHSLVTGCPIDVRSGGEGNAGNMVGFMALALCTDIANPRERLQAIHQKSSEAKAYAQALGPRLAVEITDLIPGNILALAIHTAALTGLTESSVFMNTVVTNVPGPPWAQYFCGAEMLSNFSLGPLLPNIGLFHVIYSTVQNKRGTITLSFTACRQMLPDPERYARCLQEAHDEIAEALLTNKAKAPRRNTRAHRPQANGSTP